MIRTSLNFQHCYREPLAAEQLEALPFNHLILTFTVGRGGGGGDTIA